MNIVENTDNTINITFPTAPDTSDNLTDPELGMAAGGSGKLQCSEGWGASVCQVCTPQC